MKNSRQEAILSIIENERIDTQDELQQRLAQSGFNATQSTVSRDLKQLRIHKVLDSDGNYRYASPEKIVGAGLHYSDDYYRDLFRRAVKKIDSAYNDVVIKCYSGMASSVGVVIDGLFEDYIVGSLAGEDTVLIITKDISTAEELTQKLNTMI